MHRVAGLPTCSWNGFGCNYNDATFRAQADALVSSGLAAAGYRTMIIQARAGVECALSKGERPALRAGTMPAAHFE